jgi:hypothetical protein
MALNSRQGDDLLVVTFFNHTIVNPSKTAQEGRPIFDDVVVCQIRTPGGRNTVPVFPALAFCGWIDDPITGEQKPQTYAERFSKQYRQFKEQQQQTISGTPIDYAPFLTEGKRAELRAMAVYTIEQLAHIDGQELKNLGLQGREWKNLAIEYLVESKSGASIETMRAELEALRAANQVLQDDNEQMKTLVGGSGNGGEGQFATMTDDQVREYIKAHAGHAPQGNLPRKRLVQMATELRPNKAA